MNQEIAKRYDPAETEGPVYLRWLQAGAFAAFPDGRRPERRYVIMMPLPNVTGALHMGHAMDNVMQDLLIRWHRMKGDNTLWMAGTDHAGIATQAVVEKRLFELEGKTRHDIGREGLVRRIWEWKEEYQQRIIRQQQEMGCSCDWDRQRFTMDPVCTRAVREAFFRLFRNGLIYRGDRLVNWDCQLQTAVSDDEIIHETVQGHFWHIRYPVIDPRPGEPEFVTVATTRPETMLGDTAVAVHPDPAAELDRLSKELPQKIAAAPAKEKPGLEKELEEIGRRKRELLPHLLKLRDMAAQGRCVLLPLLDRPIPLILDEWARPELGSGCVKITPGHDPNDNDVWKRHRSRIGIISILNADGSLNQNAGPYAGLDRFEARKKVIQDLQAKEWLESVEDREIEIGHSDRSKTPIEPFLSKQWFIHMGDVEGGIVCGAGTDKEFRAAGLAPAAIDATGPDYESPSGRRLEFHPDAERYRGTYVSWLAEKRDWCISRQLWWGHRIPIWHGTFEGSALGDILSQIPKASTEELFVWVADQEGNLHRPQDRESSGGDRFDLLVCLRNAAAQKAAAESLEKLGLVQDPDVLDTWFSSALWPFSTLGWPDPETAEIDPGKPTLGAREGFENCLDYYYPGSCLVTGRDIITLWVARMQVMGLFLLGDVPFTDCFIHANIQDGKGERMSKSKGNGIDPVDIIEKYGTDAMRYVLCDMQTGTQDIRLPVQAISPYTGKLVDLATAKHGRTIFTYLDPETGKEFDVLGTIKDLPVAKIISERFEVGRAFCTKLWNAARFALVSLKEEAPEDFRLFRFAELEPEDRWILGRLRQAIEAVTGGLSDYNPSQALGAAREFFWGDFCDWYIELIKPRLKEDGGDPRAGAVLALGLDQILRLFHPFVPFITEALWESLGRIRPRRGIDSESVCRGLLITAAWPEANPGWSDERADADMQVLQDIVRSIRNWRSSTGLSPSRKIAAVVRASGPDAKAVLRMATEISHLAALEKLEVRAEFERPATAAKVVHRGMEIFLLDVVDVETDRKRLQASLQKWRRELEQAEKRLANPNFVDRAPAAVVAEERRRLEAARREIELIEAGLKGLT
ncbi:MAG TPA: valine--tRNA ligase [Candidatus Desulfaltia sp.]|nr:valine--tRNA ligase [Candidatus Desulfaltia sp.]